VAAELRATAFRVRTLGSYGEQKMIEGCVAFLARKSGKDGSPNTRRVRKI